MKTVYAAILGLGTVGGGAYDILVKNHDLIASAHGVDIQVKKVLDRNTARLKELGLKDCQIASDLAEITSDPEISVVAELIGGVEPAKSFILKVLESGKSVVTANKELISKHWSQLEEAAKKSGAGLYFEASCVGGVPIIRALKESFQGDHIQKIVGIINGTTNYILTKMAEEGRSYEEVLKEAQKLGFAESDPTADVDGYDAMYKLSILSSLAFHTCIPYTEIYREGIRAVSADDIKCGKELGYVLKLLAIGKRRGDEIEVRVHPAFIKETHPLSSVRDSYNAVFLNGDYVGDIMLYGRGAGARPTGSAVVSDMVYCSKQSIHSYSDFNNNGKLSKEISIAGDFNSKYYMSLTVADEAGVMASIAKTLGNHGVSIRLLSQKDTDKEFARIIIMTHDISENNMRLAVEDVKNLQKVKSLNSLIRVID